MSSFSSIVIRATEEQILAYESQCDLTERLMAQTLATRLGVHNHEPSINAICDWFRSVRMMSIAAHAASGISLSVTTKG